MLPSVQIWPKANSFVQSERKSRTIATLVWFLFYPYSSCCWSCIYIILSTGAFAAAYAQKLVLVDQHPLNIHSQPRTRLSLSLYGIQQSRVLCPREYHGSRNALDSLVFIKMLLVEINITTKSDLFILLFIYYSLPCHIFYNWIEIILLFIDRWFIHNC